MKKSVVILTLAAVIGLAGVANAGLYTIGTVSYDGSDQKLIYEGELGGQGLVWLDYTSKTMIGWQQQINWVSGLSFTATHVTLKSEFTTTIDWTTGWRLPRTNESSANLTGPWSTAAGDGNGFGWGGPDTTGLYDYKSGYNMVNSEMGHLFYESLGNKGYYAKDGTYPQPGWGLQNVGDFSSLEFWRENFNHGHPYWTDTEYSLNPGDAWRFNLSTGNQNHSDKGLDYYAMAVHPGVVSAVPVPPTMLLVGSGLAGLAAFRRRFRRN